jgi:uncharacterized protein
VNFEMIAQPLLGGVLIGIAVTLMLLFNGRVTGIAGIIYGIFGAAKGDMLWRWMFIAGLVVGGFALKGSFADAFVNTATREIGVVAIAGLIVGFGTVMGSGCTSGHGVCGMSRLSPRSIVATLLFMLFGFVSVYLFRTLVGV